jgi:acetylornithine deacetylase/succinyl-diaminopimelate desuccinylase-like protein
VRVRATGPAGHGSRFVERPAVDKLVGVASRMLAFREAQKCAYEAGCACGRTLGDFTTVNVTSLRAGVPGSGGVDAYNVVPTGAEAGVNIRVPVTSDLPAFMRQLDEWTTVDAVSEAG